MTHREEQDAIAEILETHGMSLIKVAGLVQHGHMSTAEVLVDITIATEELLALKKLLAATRVMGTLTENETSSRGGATCGVSVQIVRPDGALETMPCSGFKFVWGGQSFDRRIPCGHAEEIASSPEHGTQKKRNP